MGPLFAKEGVKTKLMLSEAPNRSEALAEYPTVLDDPDARKYVAAVPYHGYGLKSFGRIAQLHEKYPDLPLWMTELCHAYQAGTPKSMKLPRTDFEDGDFWGQHIFSDVEAGASAWIYWNMILDHKGGPWLVSEVHGDPPGNSQHPVVIINTGTGEVHYPGLYWYLAHFSRYVRPGAQRIGSAGAIPDLIFAAFDDPATGHILQVVSSAAKPRRFAILEGTRSAEVEQPARSIATYLWQ